MADKKYEIKVSLNKKGSSGLRYYLMECGFELYRNVPILHSFERVSSPIRLDEDEKIDDLSTFSAYYNSNSLPREWTYLRKKIEESDSVTEFRFIMRRELPEVPIA